MNLENKKYWIWFSLIKGLGSRTKANLLEIYKNPEKIYKSNKEDLLKISGIGEKIVSNIVNSKNERIIQYHIDFMNKNEIDIININENYYPEILRKIYDPPVSLYIKGNKSILNDKNIGIIGCRDCTEYGKEVSKYFSYNLALNNINIVSGLARGIDSYSHIGCLCACKENKNIGKTIAVLGNGLDIIYPRENYKLAEKIISEGGAIISEYPCGTKPSKMNFPARNRIVSGISHGIVVVEAKEKSGTLITVDFALEHGRDIFVVPGNINSLNSIGTNELIKEGAKLVTNYRDILEFYK